VGPYVVLRLCEVRGGIEKTMNERVRKHGNLCKGCVRNYGCYVEYLRGTM